MSFLYCISKKRKEKDEYTAVSVHHQYAHAIIAIHDEKLRDYKNSLIKVGRLQSEKHKETLERLQIYKNKPSPPTTEIIGEFKITRVQNLITSETALKNTINHIDKRFAHLIASDSKHVCFPEVLISERIREDWHLLDPHNSADVISCIESHISHKIQELHGFHTITRGHVTKNTADMYAVQFTDSNDYHLSDINNFRIIISPATGFTHSL